MTDAMLRMARAVYPKNAVTCDTFGLRIWNGRGGHAVPFDPANNADQFCDVLAWLLNETCIEVDSCKVSGDYKYMRMKDVRDDAYVQIIDGTASGIRRAVVEAAMRVAK